jgi:hypothetical protein
MLSCASQALDQMSKEAFHKQKRSEGSEAGEDARLPRMFICISTK